VNTVAASRRGIAAADAAIVASRGVIHSLGSIARLGNDHAVAGTRQAGTISSSSGVAAAQMTAAASTQCRNAAERRRSSAEATKPAARMIETFTAAFKSGLIAVPPFALS
jgi:hypothetical protein